MKGHIIYTTLVGLLTTCIFSGMRPSSRTATGNRMKKHPFSSITKATPRPSDSFTIITMCSPSPATRDHSKFPWPAMFSTKEYWCFAEPTCPSFFSELVLITFKNSWKAWKSSSTSDSLSIRSACLRTPKRNTLSWLIWMNSFQKFHYPLTLLPIFANSSCWKTIS